MKNENRKKKARSKKQELKQKRSERQKLNQKENETPLNDVAHLFSSPPSKSTS